MAVESDKAAEIWHSPIWTVSLSEGGFEKVYQGTTLVHRFSLHLTAQPQEIGFDVRVGTPRAVLPDRPVEAHAG